MNQGTSGVVARTVMAMSMIALVGACASTKEVKDVKPPVAGGFLPDPSLLKPGKEGQLGLVYFNPAANLSSYNKFILEPLTVWVAPGSEADKIPPAEQEALANSLHDKLYKVLIAHCQEAKAPGPGVFVLRIALVDPQESAAVMRTISTYVPQAHLLNTLGSYAFNGGVSRWAGDATIEGYAKDSLTGALLWQGVDKRAGGNALGTNTFNSWNDVDAAGTAWAELLAKRLQELGMCKQTS